MAADGPLYPYQYQIVYALLREPLTASELAQEWWAREWVRFGSNPTLSLVNRLRPLIARGWVEKLPHDPASGIYRATPKARESLSW